jgi:hypothetical protein
MLWDGAEWISDDRVCNCIGVANPDIYRYRLSPGTTLFPGEWKLYLERVNGTNCIEVVGEWRNEFFYRPKWSNWFIGGVRQDISTVGLLVNSGSCFINTNCRICVDSRTAITCGGWPIAIQMTLDLDSPTTPGAVCAGTTMTEEFTLIFNGSNACHIGVAPFSPLTCNWCGFGGTTVTFTNVFGTFSAEIYIQLSASTLFNGIVDVARISAFILASNGLVATVGLQVQSPTFPFSIPPQILWGCFGHFGEGAASFS